MTSISIGTIIWISVKPILKLVAIAAAGALLAKKGHLHSAVLKGMSATVINVFMPCLLFSKTVPSFTTDNLPEVGVLILTAVFYQFCGLMIALIVRWLTPVPGWRNGLIFAGLFSNWGDIPLAFVMTLASSPPFTSADEELGIAYISVILVWCFLTMFPFGGWMLVKRDFEYPAVRTDIEERGAGGSGVRWLSCVRGVTTRRTAGARAANVPEPNSPAETVSEDKDFKVQPRSSVISTSTPTDHERHSTSTIRELEVISSHHPQTDETELQDLSLAATPSLTHHRNLTHPTPLDPLYKRIAKSVLKFILSLISPPAISCLLSLLIALIPTLKALFVDNVPGITMPDAPDGNPPLQWILDITTFGGGASVPTGLIVLGASLATLNFRHGLPPWGSIALMAILKLAVLPIIGVLWTQLLTYHSPLVNEDQKMLRFIMIFLSGVPTATTQVVLTQVFAPQGRGTEELNALSAFLISQYLVMLVSLTILVAYSLHILF